MYFGPDYLQEIGFNSSDPATKESALDTLYVATFGRPRSSTASSREYAANPNSSLSDLFGMLNLDKRTPPPPPPPGMENVPKFSDMNPSDVPRGGPYGRGMGQMPSYEGRMGGIGGMPQYGSNPMQQGGMSSRNPFGGNPLQAIFGEMFGGNPFQTSYGGRFGGNPYQPSYGVGFGGNPYQPSYGRGFGGMPRRGYYGGGFGGPSFQDPYGGGFGFQGNYGNPGYSYGGMPFQGNSPYGMMSGGQAVNAGSPRANPFGSFAIF